MLVDLASSLSAKATSGVLMSMMSESANPRDGATLKEVIAELEMQLIGAAMARHNGNISRVANELGLTRRGLYLKLSRYRIKKDANCALFGRSSA